MSYIKYLGVVLVTLVCLPFTTHAAFGDVSTYISRPYYGDTKPALEAFFDFPEDIVANSNGGFIIADTYNHVIRRITSDGIVKTVAGNASYGFKDGAASSAEFAMPKGVDVANKIIYVADTDNGRIRKIQDGVVSTLAKDLDHPQGVNVYNSTVYFTDTGNNALKKVSKNGGSVQTVTSALNNPRKLDISDDGKYAYVANNGTHQVKRVDLSTGAVVTIAGSGSEGSENGSCSEAEFEEVWGVHLLDADTLFVSSGNGSTDSVRKIELGDCIVSDFASDAGMVTLNFPRAITSFNDRLYVISSGLSIVQRFDIDDPGDGTKFAGANRFNVRDSKPVLTGNPKFMVFSKNKKRIYFSENNRIRTFRLADKKNSSVVAGSVVDNYPKNKDDEALIGENTRFSDVTSITLSSDGEFLYVVDRNNNRIRKVELATKAVTYLTGAGKINLAGSQKNDYADGDACPDEYDTDVDGCAYFSRPQGSVLSKDGTKLYITDTGNNRIRVVTVAGDNIGKVETIAGSGEAGFTNGTGTNASFNTPIGITRSKGGKALYVVDRGNHAVRKIKLSDKSVTTLVGKGKSGYLDGKLNEALLSYPEWIRRGTNGRLFFSEPGSHRIRVIDKEAGVTKLIAGSGHRGYYNGPQKHARFNNPKGLLQLNEKTLLVSDMFNDVIRKINIEGEVPFTEPAPVVSSAEPPKIAKEWFTDPSVASMISVYGSNFRYGAKTYIGPYAANKTYVNSSTKLAVDIPIENMPAGYYTIRVINSDGQYADKFRALAVSQNGTVPLVDYYPGTAGITAK